MDHHNFTSNELAALNRQAELERLGATGRYPQGKLADNDEGELQFAVGTLHGNVVLNFGKSVASCAFSVKQAREIAYALRRHANLIECGKGGK